MNLGLIVFVSAGRRGCERDEGSFRCAESVPEAKKQKAAEAALYQAPCANAALLFLAALLALGLCDCVLESLAGNETRYLLCRDLDGFAGSGVAAFASLTFRDIEGTEADQLNGIACSNALDDVGCECVNNLFDVCLGKLGFLGNGRD